MPPRVSIFTKVLDSKPLLVSLAIQPSLPIRKSLPTVSACRGVLGVAGQIRLGDGSVWLEMFTAVR